MVADSSSHKSRMRLSIEVAKYRLRSPVESQVEKGSSRAIWAGPAATAERPLLKGKQGPSRGGRAGDINEYLVTTTAAAQLSNLVTEEGDDVRLHQAPQAS